jgi:hypothetical protein
LLTRRKHQLTPLVRRGRGQVERQRLADIISDFYGVARVTVDPIQ